MSTTDCINYISIQELLEDYLIDKEPAMRTLFDPYIEPQQKDVPLDEDFFDMQDNHDAQTLWQESELLLARIKVEKVPPGTLHGGQSRIDEIVRAALQSKEYDEECSPEKQAMYENTLVLKWDILTLELVQILQDYKTEFERERRQKGRESQVPHLNPFRLVIAINLDEEGWHEVLANRQVKFKPLNALFKLLIPGSTGTTGSAPIQVRHVILDVVNLSNPRRLCVDDLFHKFAQIPTEKLTVNIDRLSEYGMMEVLAGVEERRLFLSMLELRGTFRRCTTTRFCTTMQMASRLSKMQAVGQIKLDWPSSVTGSKRLLKGLNANHSVTHWVSESPVAAQVEPILQRNRFYRQAASLLKDRSAPPTRSLSLHSQNDKREEKDAVVEYDEKILGHIVCHSISKARSWRLSVASVSSAYAVVRAHLPVLFGAPGLRGEMRQARHVSRKRKAENGLKR